MEAGNGVSRSLSVDWMRNTLFQYVLIHGIKILFIVHIQRAAAIR